MNRRSFLGCAVAGVACCFLPEEIEFEEVVNISLVRIGLTKIIYGIDTVNSVPILLRGKLREAGTVMLKSYSWNRTTDGYRGKLVYLYRRNGFGGIHRSTNISAANFLM